MKWVPRLCASLLVPGLLSATPGAGAAPTRGRIQLYVMPDTQTWAWNQGGTTLDAWRSVARAICRQRDRFAMVLHTGDLVDHPQQPLEWENATSVLQELDACAMPYAVAFGNHDFDNHPGAENVPLRGDLRWRDAMARLAHRPLALGPSGRSALHRLAPGWFVLTADYVPSQADLDWIAAAIGARREARFVLLNHHCVDPGGVAAGEWCEQLLERHPEIRIAVSGHWLGSVREAWREIPRRGGPGLVALFQNYQHTPELAAWGVVLELDPVSGGLCVWSENLLTGDVSRPAVASSPAGPVTEGADKRCFAGAASDPR